jgi:hypothetical protein
MKKIVTLLFTSLIVLLMFVSPGAPVQAEGNECGCVTEEIFGAEKNKIVSDLLKSDELKNARKELKTYGYQWNGVGKVEVTYNLTWNILMIGIPVKYSDGTSWTAVFFDGVFVGVTPHN